MQHILPGNPHLSLDTDDGKLYMNNQGFLGFQIKLQKSAYDNVLLESV